MSRTNKWPDVVRSLHVSGGLKINSFPEGGVSLSPVEGGADLKFSIAEFSHLYKKVQKMGFVIVGCEFITHARHLNNTEKPDWRPFNFYENGPWKSFDASQSWRQIAYHSYQVNDFSCFEISQRIAHQLQICIYRMRSLSNVYREALYASVKGDTYRNGKITKNTFSGGFDPEIHSILSDLCSLRDYISEFYAKYILKENSIQTHGSLLKRIKSHSEKNELEQYIIKSSYQQNDAWLFKLSALRDISIHNCPISNFSDLGNIRMRSIVLDHDIEVPSLYYPLPADVKEIQKKSSRRESYDYFEEWRKNALRRDFDDWSSDALVILSDLFGELVGLAIKISYVSPVQPKQIHITDKDIVDMKYTGKDGKTMRLKWDNEKGKLIEYYLNP